MKQGLISSAIVAIASAQIIIIDTEAFDASMKCGRCIKNGYGYCHRGTYGQTVSLVGVAPSGTCCENDQCVEASNTDYQCSFTFTDTEYAMSMCPQKQSICGSKQTIEFGEEYGDTSSITATGMGDGDSCTYKILSSKGAPAFKVVDTASINSNNFEITFLEFEASKVEKTDGTLPGEGLTAADAPAAGFPKRSQTFYDSGSQGNLNKGDQKKPPRLMRDDVTMTDGESIDLEKSYFEAKEEKQEEDENKGWFSFSFGSKYASRRVMQAEEGEDQEIDYEDEEWGGKPYPAEGQKMSETTAIEGYGVPTKGLYEVSEKGYKTFGSTG